METIESLKAKQEKEFARLEAELHVASLAPLAPDYVQLDRNARRPARLTYRKRSLTQAMEVASTFGESLPIYRHKGTFCELVPEGFADERAEVTGGPFACFLDVSQGDGFGPTAKLTFFARVADPLAPGLSRVVRVTVDIDGPDYIGGFSTLGASRQPVRWGQRGEVAEWRFTPNNALAGLSDDRVHWAAGDKTSAHFTYLFCADTEEPAPFAEQTHALGQLRNLRDEFQPAAELIESTARADYYRIPGVKGAADCFAAVKPGDPAPANAAGYYSLESLKSLKGDSE